jgi:hypothetical protein
VEWGEPQGQVNCKVTGWLFGRVRCKGRRAILWIRDLLFEVAAMSIVGFVKITLP